MGVITFKDYKSAYQPVGLEAMKILRERYDANKANADLVERTLGSYQTSSGDKYLVDKVQNEVNDMLGGIIETGAYERGGSVIDDAVTHMMTDRGLQLATQSYKARQRELEFIEEQSQEGRVLDFGKGAWDEHVSYYVDDEGVEHENVYMGKAEGMADYMGTMTGMVGKISADWTGISKEKADNIARMLTESYINGSEVGDQDYRRLMHLDLKDIPEDQRDKAARNNIYKRFQSLTRQQVFTSDKAAAAAGGVPLVDNRKHMVVRNYAVPSKWSDTKQLLMDHNVQILQNKDPKVMKDFQLLDMKLAKRVAQNPEEFKEWKYHNIDLFAGHEEFGALVHAMTMHGGDQGVFDADMTGVGGQVGAGAGAGVVGGSLALGLGTGPFGWLGTILAAGAAGLGIEGAVKKVFNTWDNVRDEFRPQGNLGKFGAAGEDYQGETSRGLGSGMNAFLLWDSEISQLEENLMQVDKVNELLGTNYSLDDPDYQQLVRNALDTYAWRVNEGGDQMEKRMNDFDGNIWDAELYIPSLENSDAMTLINKNEDFWQVANWDYVGLPEGSDSYKALIGENAKGDQLSGAPNVEFKGITQGDIFTDTPWMFSFEVNGKPVLARSKKSTAAGAGLEEQIAGAIGKGDMIVVERVRNHVNYLETQRKDGQVYGEDVYSLMTNEWINMGYSDAQAIAASRGFMIDSFMTQHPKLGQMMIQEVQVEAQRANANHEDYDQYAALWQKLIKLRMANGKTYLRSAIR